MGADSSLEMATTSPPSAAPPDLELQLGHLCSNRCVFCSSGEANARGHAGTVPLEQVVGRLRAQAAAGVRRVILVGGEPTIQKTFFPILEEILRLGLREVQVFTNGCRLAEKGFVDRVMGYGEVSWRVSIQGPDAEVHDRVTAHRGSFERLCRGLDVLVARGLATSANTCVTKLNFEFLPAMGDVIERFSIRHYHVDMVRPEDAGARSDAELRGILVPYSQVAAPLREMLTRFESSASKTDVSVGAFPFCLLPDQGHRISHGGEATVTCDASGPRTLTYPRDKYAKQAAGAGQTSRCDGCAFGTRCRGLPRRYREVFGDAGIHAVTLEELRILDPCANNLGILAAPLVAELMASLPKGVRVGRIVDRPRERRFEIRMVADADEVTARFGAAVHDPQRRDGPAGALDVELVVPKAGCSRLSERVAEWLGDRAGVRLRSPAVTVPTPAERRGDPVSADRVDIKIGFACNNRCEFCVQGTKRERYGARPLEQVRSDLDNGLKGGAKGIVITGGEPTVQANLLGVVRLARTFGYERIQIQSNGRMFSRLSYCEDIIAAGANEFALALHGARAATHDRLTRAAGSFRQTVIGIRNLKRLGQDVLTNTVITSVNFHELPDLAGLLTRLGVGQYQFAFVHILGTAARNAKWLVPRKRQVMPFVRAGLDIGRRAGVRAMTEAIPFCLMAGYEDCVAEQIIPRTVVFDADVTLPDYTEYRRTEGKAKGPMCACCVFDRRCEGPWAEYPTLFGWEEFVAVEVQPGNDLS